MTASTRWTVVSHAADHSPAAASAASLVGWLADEPTVDLHSVLWAWGHAGAASYDRGRFVDVGAVHRAIGPRALRRVGLVRVGGGLAGRGVRSALRDVPRDGVLYLSSAQAGAVLRYLPAGNRTVITHVHALDRRADPPLADDKVAALVAATDLWLADDADTMRWLADTWGIDGSTIVELAPPVDPGSWNRATTPTDPEELRLGIAGGEWFLRDHTPRLVQALRRLRPALRLDLVWMRAVTTTDHLGPLLHDLERLGVVDALELSPLPDGPIPVLDDIDALALALPDEDAPWLTREALGHGVPIVCFATHRDASSIRAGGGVAVDYPDVAAMAQAIVDLNEGNDRSGAMTVLQRRAALHQRDVRTVGPHLMALVDGLEQP